MATVARLKAELDRRMTPEAWTAVTFQNGWANAGDPLQAAQYRLEPGGIVRIRGSVVDSTSGTIFTLPAGYVPPANLLFAVDTSGDAAISLNVQSTGAVTVNVSGTARVSLNVAFAV